MGQVQFEPSQDRWGNLGTAIGNKMGQLLDAKAQNEALAKGLGIISNQANPALNPTPTNDQITAAADQISGMKGLVGMNGVNSLADLQNNWVITNNKLTDINNQIAGTSDQNALNALNQQKTNLQNQLDGLHQKADYTRGLLSKKGVDLTGLGANDDVNQFIQNNNNVKADLSTQAPAATSAIQAIDNAKATYDNAKNELDSINAKLANPDVNTDVQGLQARASELQKNMEDAHSNAEWAKNSMFNPILLGTYGKSVIGIDGNYNTNQGLLPKSATDAIKNAVDNKYNITLEDVAKDPAIANLAKGAAYGEAIKNFNPTIYTTDAMAQLVKAGLGADTIAKLQPLIEKQTSDIQNKYMSILLSPQGDTREAARRALGMGMGNNGIKIAQDFAPKYQVEKTDTGGTVNFHAVGTDPFGSTPTFSPGPFFVKSSTPGEVLTHQDRQDTLKQNKDQFDAKMDQSDRQFNLNYQLARDRFNNEKDYQIKQYGLKQLEDIAGMANSYKAQIAGYQNEINSIVKAGNGMLTQSDKDNIAQLQKKMEDTNTNFNLLNSTLANTMGIKLPQTSTASQSSYQPSGSEQKVADWIDQCKASNISADVIKQKLREKGYGNRFDSWVY